MDNIGGGGGFWASWTNEETAELTRFWDEGFTASEIGRKLKRSRGSVIGKVHRLDLPMRLKNEHLRVPKRKHAPRVVASVLAVERREARMLAEASSKNAPTNQPLDIWTIGEGQCRFPKHGNGAAMLYCAAPAVGSWCPYHKRIVWRANS